MLHLNSSSSSGAEWDTNYARIYLKISEDQLEKINKVPGWSKTKISENLAPENTSENIEKQVTQQGSTSAESILTTSTGVSAKDNLKNQNNFSEIHCKTNPIAPLSEKELFLKNVSLFNLKEKHTESIYSLKRSNSLPDLCKRLPSAEIPYRCYSEDIFGKQIHSTQKDVSSFKITPQLTKDVSNKTNAVPGISKDYLNQNKSFTSLLMNPNQSSKQKFTTLDDSILCHKYLKDTATSIFSNETVQTTLKQGMSSFEKKVLLLEKRLTPSKEASQSSFDSKSISLENFNHKKNLKFPQCPGSVGEIVTTAESADLVKELPDEIEISATSKSSKLFESQSINENTDALKTAEVGTGVVSKTAACNFESFVSPPLPCGQLVLPEVISQSQPIPSQVSELSIPSKLQNISGQLLPTEVPSLSQPILSQKVDKLSTPSKPQNALLVDTSEKITTSEKSTGTFSVFSTNLNEKVSHLASDKDLGTKRKRKSRSEKSSKKLKKTDILFSSAQIKNMIDVMKIFHLEF